MKRLAFVFVLIVAIAALPLPLRGELGIYNSLSHSYWCSNHIACVHEIGHKLDQEGGWISHSKEFGFAIQVYVQSEYSLAGRLPGHPSQLAQTLMIMPGIYSWNGYFSDNQSELYATLFRYADGKKENMPPSFRKFYDWSLAEKWVQEYVR